MFCYKFPEVKKFHGARDLVKVCTASVKSEKFEVSYFNGSCVTGKNLLQLVLLSLYYHTIRTAKYHRSQGFSFEFDLALFFSILIARNLLQ